MDKGETLVELDLCCPECHCSEWYSIDDEGLYGCARCNYVCSFNLGDDEEQEDELKVESHEH